MDIRMALPFSQTREPSHPLDYTSIDLHALVQESQQQERAANQSQMSREPREAPMRGEAPVGGGAPMARVDSIRSSHSEARHSEHEYLSDHDGEVDDTWLLRSKRPWWRSTWRWVQIATLLGLVVALGIAVSWLGPIVIDKAVIPALEWADTTLSKPLLIFVIVISLAVFPIFLVPSSPLIWLAGISFGYAWGYVLTLFGMALGMSATYFIGRRLLHDRVQTWINSKPRYVALLRAANQSGFWGQFRVAALFRLSPFPPYPIFNYAVTMTKIQYLPYITGSLTGIFPEIFVALYSGILLRDIADYHRGKHKITWVEITFDVVGIVVAIALVIGGAVYGRRVLAEAENSEELDGNPVGEALPNVVGSPVHSMNRRASQSLSFGSGDEESEGHQLLCSEGPTLVSAASKPEGSTMLTGSQLDAERDTT